MMFENGISYDALKAGVRGRVSEQLGVCLSLDVHDYWLTPCCKASLISRVTAVLPFTAFDEAELRALAYNCLIPHLTRLGRVNDRVKVDELVGRVVSSYRPEEGVRSLQRASASIVLKDLY
jgi:hypothetical protein